MGICIYSWLSDFQSIDSKSKNLLKLSVLPIPWLRYSRNVKSDGSLIYLADFFSQEHAKMCLPLAKSSLLAFPLDY